MVDAGGVLREVTLFWKGVEAREQSQSFIGHQGHGVALALDGPKFESQAGAQGLFGRDHFGSRQVGLLGQFVKLQAHQVWEEEKESAAARDKGVVAQAELAHIGDRFNSGAGVNGPFLIQAPGQRSKALDFEYFAHRRWAEGALALVEGAADVVDGEILFAQLDDQLSGG
jgi:hypothetical protein